MSEVRLKCSQCNAICWVKAQYEDGFYFMHEDVDLDEAEWTRGDWPECSHDEDPEVTDVQDDPHFWDDAL